MERKKQGVLVVGSAWHSCGSHQLYKAQINVYNALGYEVYFLAVCPHHNILGEGRGYWDYYLSMTADIPTAFRGEAKLSRWAKVLPSMLFDQAKGIKRTPCYLRTLNAKHSILPPSFHKFIANRDIKLIHCNHYFNLPMADKIKRLAKIPQVVCETQDIQTRHLIKTDVKHPFTRVIGTYNSYFSDEVLCASGADDFVHLNEEEYEIFKAALPTKRHHLIYPSVARQNFDTKAKTEVDFLIVSSANMPNYHSLVWFLREVWNDEFNAKAKLRIIGNIDYVFQTEKDDLIKRYGKIFLSRVENVAEWYAKSRTVLAPVTEGQGISMKTVEALSFGKPFLFSPLAIRGFGKEPIVTILPGLCQTADEFRVQIRKALASATAKKRKTTNPEAIRVFDTLFAPEVYKNRIRHLIQN